MSAETCEKCGTDHDGLPPGSLGAEIRCVRQQADDLGAEHLVDQVDALRADLALRRDRGLFGCD